MISASRTFSKVDGTNDIHAMLNDDDSISLRVEIDSVSGSSFGPFLADGSRACWISVNAHLPFTIEHNGVKVRPRLILKIVWKAKPGIINLIRAKSFRRRMRSENPILFQ